MSATEQRPVRVLIVEDQALVRQGLRTILDLEEGIQVVGEAADGVEALKRIPDLLPVRALADGAGVRVALRALQEARLDLRSAMGPQRRQRRKD